MENLHQWNYWGGSKECFSSANYLTVADSTRKVISEMWSLEQNSTAAKTVDSFGHTLY